MTITRFDSAGTLELTESKLVFRNTEERGEWSLQDMDPPEDRGNDDFTIWTLLNTKYPMEVRFDGNQVARNQFREKMTSQIHTLSSAPAIWEWQRPSDARTWIAYDTQSTDRLETALRKEHRKPRVTIDGTQYTLDWYRMSQTSSAGVEMQVRRTGPRARRLNVLPALRMFRRYRVSNDTPHRLELCDQALGKDTTWLESASGRIESGGSVQFSGQFPVPSCVRYATIADGSQEPLCDLLFELGPEATRGRALEPDEPCQHELYKAKECSRIFCSICRSSTHAASGIELRWSVVMDGFNQHWQVLDKSSPAGLQGVDLKRPGVAKPVDIQHLDHSSSLGYGSTFVTFTWCAVTTCMRDFIPGPEENQRWRGQCIRAKQGQLILVVKRVDPDWSLVRTRSETTGNDEEGYLPNCILIDDRADHSWEVEVSATASGSSAMAQCNVLRQEDQDESGDGPEFIWAWQKNGNSRDTWSHYSEDTWERYSAEQARQLEDALLDPEKGQVVKVDEEREVYLRGDVFFQARLDAPDRQRIVRRFTKLSLFDLDEQVPLGCTRPCTEWRKINSATYEGIVCGLEPGAKYTLRIRPAGSGEAWSQKLDVATTKAADRRQPERSAALQTEVDVLADTERTKRWLRVRPDFSRADAVDMIWRIPMQTAERRWTVQVFKESSGQKREDMRTGCTDGVPESCGRVCVSRNEIVRLECTKVAKISWKLYPCDQVVQAEQIEARYLWVHARLIRLAEVKVQDADGRPVVVAGAAMSSSYVRRPVRTETTHRSFPARNVLDGRLDTFCWTRGQKNGSPHNSASTSAWLRVDLGRSVTVGRIEIVSYIDDDGTTISLAGARLRLTASPKLDEDPAWESTVQTSGPIHRYVFSSSEPEPEPTLQLEVADSAPFDVDPHKYPPEDYEQLKGLVAELTTSGEWPSPSISLVDRDIDVQLPFAPGLRAGEIRVIRQFQSKAKPYQVEMYASGSKTAPINVVVKDGDDLRQDQVVLVILEFFNKLWEREGVVHHPEGGEALPVKAPVYNVATANTQAGFVEMLPDAVPVDDVRSKDTFEGNDWRPSPELMVSAVAAFVSGYVLRMRDRHKGNMVLCKRMHFANIDFGWLEEQPSIDTGPWPIPQNLKAMLKKTGGWAEFCDLCWDALCVLRANQDEVMDCWRRHLVKVEPSLAIPYYHHELTGKWAERMEIMTRRVLDKELDRHTLGTQLKDLTHGMGRSFLSSKTPSGPTLEADVDTPTPAVATPTPTAPTPTPTAATPAPTAACGSTGAKQDSVEVRQSDIQALKEEMTALKTDLRDVKQDVAAMKDMMQDMLGMLKKTQGDQSRSPT